MTISVDIADRLYDYTDEEKAATAIAIFQSEMGMDDAEIVAVWSDEADPRHKELEKRIFDAVDHNGSEKRARETIPCGIYLSVDTDLECQTRKAY